ncbi:hypothetical protein, partial [Pseudomonas syringae]|uniref:hypothetical protein n=1 Tax=Pseudomonas syringae TaxID=317 RepID=UPI000517AB67
KPALCGLCCFWLLVLDEIGMCASHVIGEKTLARWHSHHRCSSEHSAYHHRAKPSMSFDLAVISQCIPF